MRLPWMLAAFAKNGGEEDFPEAIGRSRTPLLCTENLSSGVVVVKSAKDSV
jgi:hypothetical protein